MALSPALAKPATRVRLLLIRTLFETLCLWGIRGLTPMVCTLTVIPSGGQHQDAAGVYPLQLAADWPAHHDHHVDQVHV